MSNCRRASLYLLVLLQILQARRRRLREDRLRRARARLERFRRFFQRQRSDRAVFVATLSAMINTELLDPPRRLWMINRTCEWWDDSERWTEKQWLDNMRMSKNIFQFICDELEDHLRKETTNMRVPIPVSKRVGLTLVKMATNAEYRTLEDHFAVAKSSICKILREVCEAIIEKFGEQFVRPPSHAELDSVVEGFESEFGLPQCAGVLECTHVPILSPSAVANPSEHCNAGGWHSVLLQVLVDNSYCILDVHVGNKGSMRMAQHFRSSPLYSKGEAGQLLVPSKVRELGGSEVPLYVVAGQSYPLSNWLMKPFLESSDHQLNDGQRLFNDKVGDVLDLAAVAVDRLKGRWHCVRYRNDGDLDFLPTIVRACCVVHNMCESLQQPFDDEWLKERAGDRLPPVPVEDPVLGGPASAGKIRDALVKYLVDESA